MPSMTEVLGTHKVSKLSNMQAWSIRESTKAQVLSRLLCARIPRGCLTVLRLYLFNSLSNRGTAFRTLRKQCKDCLRTFRVQHPFTLSAICLVSVSCFDFLGSTLKDKVPLKPSFSVIMDEFIHEATRLPKENF